MENNKNIWSAVSLKPNQFKRAEANIKQQGFTFFAPKIKVTKRQKNRFINKTELLFPGYIFVQISTDSSDIRKLQSTYGVSNIIRSGSQVGAVPEPFIDALKANFALNDIIHSETLKLGQQVKITKGPFAGLIGELTQVESSTRVKCLLDLIWGKISASLLIEDLIVTY